MLISIIIPIYNSEDFIDRCVSTCLSQNYSDIELILIDDGSTDSSYDICKGYQESDSRVTSIHQENAGASAARNKGLDVAKGMYVMFVDSDDWIDQDMVDNMVLVALEHPEVQVIQTRVPKDMRHQSREGIYGSEEAVKSLLEGSWWGPYCKLIKRDTIGDLRFSKNTISEDYLFNYQLFSQLDNLYYTDRLYYHRTNRPNSLSKLKLSKRKFDEFNNVKTVSNLVAEDFPQYQQLADLHLAGTCLKLLYSILKNHSGSQYYAEMEEIVDCIRSKYFSFLKNPHIPWKERILLSTCFSKNTARLSEIVYHSLK